MILFFPGVEVEPEPGAEAIAGFAIMIILNTVVIVWLYLAIAENTIGFLDIIIKSAW
jgi:hypothetical protein